MSKQQADRINQLLNKLQKGKLPYNADRVQIGNPDANGNYQTITYSRQGFIVQVINLVYDENGEVIDATIPIV